MTPESVQALDAMKRLLERGVEDDVTFRAITADGSVLTARGMRSIERAGRGAGGLAGNDCPPLLGEGEARRAMTSQTSCMTAGVRSRFRFSVAAFLAGRRAKGAGETNHLRHVRDRRGPGRPGVPRSFDASVIGRINDARLLADYNAWIKRAQQATYAHIIQIQWPAVNIFAIQEKLDPPDNGSDCSPLKPQSIGAEGHRDNRAGRRRRPPLLPYVPAPADRLCPAGRPRATDRQVLCSRKGPFTVWDNIKDISPPNRKGFYP